MLSRQHPCSMILSALIIAVALSPVIAPTSYAVITDPEYHNLQEVYDRIFFLEDSLRNAGRDWLRVDSIGFSQHDHLPIYAVRITNDVDNPALNKPAVVFNGQVHAEEVLGVELCLWLIPRILANNRWRSTVDTYILPTTNPEGLQVVYSFDNTYRKNMRDNIGDGRFRWQPGWGLDTSGVDINRNFPLFWTNGSTFLKGGDNEYYDYYRGPGPLSEPETQAIDNFINRIRPLYSMVIHSSRTGNVAEQIIYPWHYGNKTKKCPDQDAYDVLATDVAVRCLKYSSRDKTYEPTRIVSAQGDCEAYLYWKYGVFAMRAEIGDKGEAMQPDSVGIYQVLNDVIIGMEYLLNAAARIDSDQKGAICLSRLDIKVTDQVSGAPLEAKLVLPKLSSSMIPHRKTNPLSGWYRWLVFNGFNDTLNVSCFGYQSRRFPITGGTTPLFVGNGVRLNPLPRYSIQFALNDGSLPITRDIELEISHPDSTWNTVIPGGTGLVEFPEGDYRLTFLGGWDYVPRQVSVSIHSDDTLHVSLSKAFILLGQDFDYGDIAYTTDNQMNNIPDHTGTDSTATWELTEDVFHSFPRSITDSRRGKTFRNEDAWIAPYSIFDYQFDLANSGTASLVYWLNQALEPGFDSLWVEAAVGNNNDPASWSWTQISPAHMDLSQVENVPLRPWNSNPVSYQRYGRWTRFVVSLDPLCGNDNVHIRFHLTTDATLQEDGVFLDDIVVYSSDQAPPAISSNNLVPARFALSSPFPNPFNNRFQVKIALPEAGHATINLYDLTGRVVLKVMDADLPAGVKTVSVEGSHLPAGTFILRATGPRMDRPEIRKLTLLK